MFNLAASILLMTGFPASPQPTLLLKKGRVFHRAFGPNSVEDATLVLGKGESAEIAVTQRGIDVVVRVRAPDGSLIDDFDSPNGREGDERVSLTATRAGPYRLRIKPISTAEPQGAIDIRLVALRSAGETERLLRRATQSRLEAAQWLRRDDAPLNIDQIRTALSIPPLDKIASTARLVGLGEATHGSRELNDVRLAIVQRLVERSGFRLVALEDSVSRWRALEPYVSGQTAVASVPTEWGWIGRRSRKALLEWARRWNLQHPSDPVRLVGVDPQDNGIARNALGPLLKRAFGQQLPSDFDEALKEVAAADEQTAVFGDSGVSTKTRDFFQLLLARLATDAPILRSSLGDADYERTLDYTSELAAFTDFNADSSNLARSRDWYMALETLRAVGDGPPVKAIYWGHNAHVSTASASNGTTGAILRRALGCGYQAIATTFGEGSFLAQLPNDLADRLHVNEVGLSDEESIESVLARVRGGTHIAAWQCAAQADKPAWLGDPHKMRWVGGLYASDSAPSASYRPFRLTDAFDAVVYVPVVHAEADPGDQPVIPARKR
jgi:erythromycin esterase